LPRRRAGIIPFPIRRRRRRALPDPTTTAMTRLRLHVALLAFLIPAVSRAQACAYPSFQPPRITVRDYNFGLASSDRGGTSLLFQWREHAGPITQFSFDVGIADPEGDEDVIAFGGVGL